MKYISADYIKAVMKGDRLMQGNCEYELWKQEVDKKVDAMPSIDVMDVVTAYQQGWCDALDASISALNDAKFQLGKEADRKTENSSEIPNNCTDCDCTDDCTECKEAEHGCKDEPQTETEIAKAIVHKMIDDSVIAEDAYPDLRQKMHDAVDEYEPQTDAETKWLKNEGEF